MQSLIFTTIALPSATWLSLWESQVGCRWNSIGAVVDGRFRRSSSDPALPGHLPPGEGFWGYLHVSNQGTAKVNSRGRRGHAPALQKRRSLCSNHRAITNRVTPKGVGLLPGLQARIVYGHWPLTAAEPAAAAAAEQIAQIAHAQIGAGVAAHGETTEISRLLAVGCAARFDAVQRPLVF